MQLGQGLHIAFESIAAKSDKNNLDSDWPLLEYLLGMDERGQLYTPLHAPVLFDQASVAAEAPPATTPGRGKSRRVLVMVPQSSDGKKRLSKRGLKKKPPSDSTAPERAPSAQLDGIKMSVTGPGF